MYWYWYDIYPVISSIYTFFLKYGYIFSRLSYLSWDDFYSTAPGSNPTWQISRNPFYAIVSNSNMVDEFVRYSQDDVRVFAIIYRVMTAPLSALGVVSDIVDDILMNIGLPTIELNLTLIDRLPFFVGILIGGIFWAGLFFILKLIAKLLLRG